MRLSEILERRDLNIYFSAALIVYNIQLYKSKFTMTRLILQASNYDFPVVFQPEISLTSPQNILVQLKGKKYPISKSFLIGSKYLQKIIHAKKVQNNGDGLKSHQTVLVLDNLNIGTGHFQTIMKYFNGEEIQLEVNKSLISFIEACQILEADPILQFIKSYFLQNFDDYDFFIMFTIGAKFQIKELKDKCMKELKTYHFEQMNFNRYDLLNCELNIFMNVMNLYYNFKNKYNEKGPSRAVAREITAEYCRINQISLNLEESISKSLDKIEEVDANLEEEYLKEEIQTQSESNAEFYKPRLIGCSSSCYTLDCKGTEKGSCEMDQEKNEKCPSSHLHYYFDHEGIKVRGSTSYLPIKVIKLRSQQPRSDPFLDLSELSPASLEEFMF